MKLLEKLCTLGGAIEGVNLLGSSIVRVYHEVQHAKRFHVEAEVSKYATPYAIGLLLIAGAAIYLAVKGWRHREISGSQNQNIAQL